MLVSPVGDFPPRFLEAMAALADDTAISIASIPDAIPLHGNSGQGLEVRFTGKEAYITWEKPVQVYRGISMLAQSGGKPFHTKETPCFETLGIMMDVSRNAVLKPEAMGFLLRKMALMGFSLGLLYTEDTYEVPSEPYFGYQRGRYTQEELSSLDDYADMLGIELCPCIQTLGHLNRALHWPALAHLKDTEEVLLADSEEVYDFLQKLIEAASAPFRSRRIHLGMDEAHGIGTGRHLALHGYETSHAIIRRHLKRVVEIARKLNLSPMIWSDMFFRPDSPTNGYYDSGEPTRSAMDALVPGLDLVYWDYYHQSEQEYSDMLAKHQKLGSSTFFAGGIWTWCGPAPDYTKTINATLPALEACRKAHVPVVIAAVWGDNGAEANFQTALLGMQLYAEYTYTGSYHEHDLGRRFACCCKGNADAFWGLSSFNTVPGMRSGALRPVNAAKFLLYQDPFVQLYAGDTQGLAMAEHYQRLWKEYESYASQPGPYRLLFTFYARLAETLAFKCQWHEQAAGAICDGDVALAGMLSQTAAKAAEAVEALRLTWYELWDSTNKPYGFEIIDLRLGGVKARMETAARRMKLFARDGIDIPELREPPLFYTKQADGTLFGSYAMGEIVSASKLDL